MPGEPTNLPVIIIGLLLIGIGFYLWGMAARHMFGLLHGFKPNMSWGRYSPFSIFMAGFFTEKGNTHRKQFLKYAGLFVAYCLTPFIVSAIWQLFSNQPA